MNDHCAAGALGGPVRRVLLGLFSLALAGALVSGARAQSLLENTDLVDVRVGGNLSDTVRDIARSGYELADGRRVGMRKWYTSPWKNMHVDFMTQLAPDAGVLWGVSSGEMGEKYRIDPALRLGLIKLFRTSENGVLSLRVVTTIGGRLREKTCSADYGQIGGRQTVNCRLAASPMAPRKTLSYLLKERPSDAVTASITYQLRF